MRPVELYAKKPALTVALCMVLATLLPLVGGWIFYMHSDRTVQRQQENIVTQSLQLTLQKLEADLDEMSGLMLRLKRILGPIELPKSASMKAEDRLALYEARTQLKDHLSFSPPYIKDILVTRKGADYLLDSGAVRSFEELKRSWKSGQSSSLLEVILTGSKENGIIRAGENALLFSMPLSRGKSPDAQNCRILLRLNEGYLESIAKSYGLMGVKYQVFGRDGRLLMQSNAEVGDSVSVKMPFGQGGYTLEAHIPSAYYRHSSLSLRVLYFGLLLGTLTGCVALIWILSRRTAIPVQRLTQYIRENYRTDTEQEVEGLNLVYSAVEQMLSEHDASQRQLALLKEQKEMHELAEAFLGHSTWNVEDSCYVAACLLSDCQLDIEKLRTLSIDNYQASYVSFSQTIYLLFVKQQGKMDEEEAARALESLLEKMDGLGYANISCTMSMVHAAADEIEVAYREAHMAADCAEQEQEAPVLRFDMIRYSPEYFLRDWHHLDKQLTFARQIGEEEYEEALQTLPFLFPEEFIRNSHSTMAQLHLSSLKYQFIHDADTFIRQLADAAEISRTLSSGIIACKTHDELLKFMQSLLMELDAQQEDPKEQQDGIVDQVKSYIRANSKLSHLTVTGISEVFGMPIDHLSKLFTRNAGIGVLQYIHKIRIEDACSLLISEDKMTIAEIAENVGYSSTLTFTRAFKARYRMTPSEYRKLHEDHHEQ